MRTASAARKTRKNVSDVAARRQKKTRRRGATNSVYLSAAALAIIVFICYGNSLANDFVFDDQYLALVYSRPRNFSHLLEMMIDSYRPVRNLSYIIDFAVWGANPFGFHLTNVLIHAANTALVFLLARRFAIGATLSMLAAIIFAVHPIQTDAVAYISGRRDVLFTLFYLAAFLSYLKYRDNKSRISFWLFLAFWALSLMSKEMAASLPAAIFLWNFCELWQEKTGSMMTRSFQAAKEALKKDRWLYLALAAAGVAYAWYMLFVRRASGRADAEGLHYWGGSPFLTALTVIRVHAWYLKQLMLPTPIAQYFGAFPISSSLMDWRALVSIATVGSMIAGGFALLKRNRFMAFAVLSYFALLLPVSQIIPHHELLADHYLYLPMMCFGLLIAMAVKTIANRAGRSRKIIFWAAAVYVAVLACLTIIRNRDWKDELAVWKANYESVPESPRASSNLGSLLARSDPQKAEALLKQAISSDPGFEPAYLSLARLYVTQKRTSEAEDLIGQGIALTDAETRSYIMRNPALLKSQFTTVLAAAKWEEGDKPATEQILRQAVAIYPQNASAHEALANLYHDQDRLKEEEALRQASAAVPEGFEIRARLVSLLIEAKKYDEAQARLQEMLALDANPGECRKARSIIAAARASTPNTFEQSAIRDALASLERRCAER
jgi:protein O-mannosyl-transferase